MIEIAVFASVLAMLHVRNAAVACPQQNKTMSFAHNRAVYLPPSPMYTQTQKKMLCRKS